MPPNSPVSIRIQQYARSHVGISLYEKKEQKKIKIAILHLFF